MKHLLSLADINQQELIDILDLADELKASRKTNIIHDVLKGQSVAMIFSKSSTRTRVSFEVGIHELGGNPMYLDKNSLQLGRGEPIADTAKVLSRYVHAIVMRYHEHEDVVELAENASVPIINALTDKYHPCQVLADLQTIREQIGKLEGIKVAYLGDGASNMAYSWIIGAKLAGIDLHIAAPKEFQPDLSLIPDVEGTGTLTVTDNCQDAVKDADIVYTDVWVSMGFESEAADRLEILKPYQVNQSLMDFAKADAKVMHCLPAYRGKEITADVLDGPQSVIWDEAENRLHVQKAVLAKLIGKK